MYFRPPEKNTPYLRSVQVSGPCERRAEWRLGAIARPVVEGRFRVRFDYEWDKHPRSAQRE